MSPPRYADSVASTTDAFSIHGDNELGRSTDGLTHDGVFHSIYGSDADVIIFLSEVGVSCEVWNNIICGLQHGYRCVVFDLPGIGDASQPFSIKMSTHVKHLWNLVSSLNQCEDVHLIGWGWGALLAIEFSMSHPEQCISVVSINAPMRRYRSIPSLCHLFASVDSESLRQHWQQCNFTNPYLLEKYCNSGKCHIDIDGIIPSVSKFRRVQHLMRFLLLRIQEQAVVYFLTREIFIPNKHWRHLLRVILHAFILSRRRVYYQPYTPSMPIPGRMHLVLPLFSKKNVRFIFMCIAFSFLKLFYTNPSIRETSSKFLVVHSNRNADGKILYDKLRKCNIECQVAELHGLHACFIESSDRFLYLVNAHLGRNAKCSSRPEPLALI